MCEINFVGVAKTEGQLCVLGRTLEITGMAFYSING
jgi:hypothetical protein